MILAFTGHCVAEQIFKLEVPKRRNYRGKADTTQVGQHRLDLKHFSLWN